MGINHETIKRQTHSQWQVPEKKEMDSAIDFRSLSSELTVVPPQQPQLLPCLQWHREVPAHAPVTPEWHAWRLASSLPGCLLPYQRFRLPLPQPAHCLGCLPHFSVSELLPLYQTRIKLFTRFRGYKKRQRHKPHLVITTVQNKQPQAKQLPDRFQCRNVCRVWLQLLSGTVSMNAWCCIYS